MAHRNYAPANGFIVSPDGTGDFKTIQAAINAATVSGQETIFIKPGTYVQNLTLQPSINLTAWPSDSQQGTVNIQGKMSYSGTGLVIISGIEFDNNGDYSIEVTGSNQSQVSFVDCTIIANNFASIHFTSSNAASFITLDGCTGNFNSNVAYFVCASAGTLNMYNCEIGNVSGNSTTASTLGSSGSLFFISTQFNAPITYSSSSTSSSMQYCLIESNVTNTTAITTSGTGLIFIFGCYIGGGTASAINIGGGTTVQLVDSLINSSNTNAITGTGTLNYGGVLFNNSSSTINATLTTTTYKLSVPQGGTAISSATAYAPIVGGTTTTGAFQSASTGLSTSGLPLITNGNAAVPSFQALSASHVNGSLPGSAPSAGVIGENILSTVTGVSVSNASPTSITSISVTQGVWMITGSGTATGSGGNITACKIGVSSANNTFQGNQGDQFNTMQGNSAQLTAVAPNYYLVLTSTQTWYVIGQANFSAGSCTIDARINALRVG